MLHEWTAAGEALSRSLAVESWLPPLSAHLEGADTDRNEVAL
jgi:hypothetical protein